MALVLADKTGKMRDFEAAVAFIVPACPVAKRKTNKKPKASIAEVDVDPTEDDGDADIGDVKSGKNKKFSKVFKRENRR